MRATSFPLKVRRRALKTLLRDQRLILPARRLMFNGFAAWVEVEHRGSEGYAAKDPNTFPMSTVSLDLTSFALPCYQRSAGRAIGGDE